MVDESYYATIALRCRLNQIQNLCWMIANRLTFLGGILLRRTFLGGEAMIETKKDS